MRICTAKSLYSHKLGCSRTTASPSLHFSWLQEFERWEAAEVRSAEHLVKQQKGVPQKGPKVCVLMLHELGVRAFSCQEPNMPDHQRGPTA